MLKWLVSDNTISECEAENKLLSENWHSHSGYTNLEKIKYHMISTKFFMETQLYIEYYFTEKEFNYILDKDNLLKSSRLKKHIRNGIPIKHVKDLMLKMFKADQSKLKENYRTRFLSIFKNRDPKNIGEHVPYLSSYDTLEANLPFLYLNKEGISAAKEILWMLYSVVPNMEFCPILIKVISITLIFLTKEECFSVLKSIILTDYGIKDLKKIRFRFRFSYEENKKLALAFIASFKEISKTGKDIINKLEKISLDVNALIEDMFYTIFMEYLNFNFLYRVYLMFISEGSKVLFRVAYAIFKLLKDDILEGVIEENNLYIDSDRNKSNSNRTNEIIANIKRRTYEFKDFPSFASLMFSYKLSQHNNRYSDINVINTFNHNRTCNYYIPTINGDSEILLDDEIFSLWNILPDNYKNKDAKLIYSTTYHERSLKKIYEICSDSENSCFNCFVLIKTQHLHTFGIVMSLPFDRNRPGYYKPAYLCLFVISPFVKRYDVINPPAEILCDDERIVIGQSKPVLEISKNILNGFNDKSEIFGCPPLAGVESNFEIENLEIFILY